ncbi:hypothetical protein HPB47_013235 [Ixodes persulcatus]|uniref:Uncharacterized protein n=1 Tax=Ixodes persulcatus TaxID=34615 RepID=A0AC60QZ06_IXOPE|nr:hypothetical protein HPB47_013235 [Ixodes persulcatus]
MAPFNAERLLEMIREHRFLYNHGDPDFKDTQMKKSRWKIIGEEFGMEASSIHLNLPEESSSDLSVARNFPVAILSLALALVGTLVAVLFGSLKPVLLTLGLVYLLLFGLSFVPTLGAIVQTGFRAFGDTLTAAIPPKSVKTCSKPPDSMPKNAVPGQSAKSPKSLFSGTPPLRPC